MIKRDEIKERKLLLEELGIDEKFIRHIGLYQDYANSLRNKQSVKIYIPKHEIELFQVMAILFKMRNSSISGYMRNSLKDYAKKLVAEKNLEFIEAKRIHREIKESQFLKLSSLKGK